MKKNMFIIIIMMLLVCSGLSITGSATDTTTSVRLPLGYVTMLAQYGQESWFDMTLSDVPVGFDVVNGQYLGWCAQKGVMMTRGVAHTVTLYSSYDPLMPQHYQCGNWDKVNYVLNHKQGERESIEQVFWYYCCEESLPTDPDAQAMIADADVKGSGFVPGPEQVCAILVEGVVEIQRTFFEVTLPPLVAVGNLVWDDTNADGIQDLGEPGIPEVTVQLINQNYVLVGTTTTDIHGYYSFSDFTTGQYYLKFVLPEGYRFSPQDQGSNDAVDSDANPGTGRTILTTFNPAVPDSSWDAGMYGPDEQGRPRRRGNTNHGPSADGTAGEPYKGFVGEEIVFNGSRSYDRDGTIVSWVWDFGDGISLDGVVVSHVYTNPETYTVLLTVIDDDGASDTYETTARIRLPNRPPSQPQIKGSFEGHVNSPYLYTIVAMDPDNDNIRYFMNWGDGSTDMSPFFKNNHEIQKYHTWTAIGFYQVQIAAIDELNASSAMVDVRIGIDVRYVENLGYLINSDSTGSFDSFFSNSTGNITMVALENGWYLLDVDGDGQWDHAYNPSTGALRAYPETLGLEYTLLLLGTFLGILLLIIISLIVKRRRNKTQKQTNASQNESSASENITP